MPSQRFISQAIASYAALLLATEVAAIEIQAEVQCGIGALTDASQSAELPAEPKNVVITNYHNPNIRLGIPSQVSCDDVTITGTTVASAANYYWTITPKGDQDDDGREIFYLDLFIRLNGVCTEHRLDTPRCEGTNKILGEFELSQPGSVQRSAEVVFIPLNIPNTYRLYFPYQHDCEAYRDGYLSWRASETELEFADYRICALEQIWTVQELDLTPENPFQVVAPDPSFLRVQDADFNVADVVPGGYWNCAVPDFQAASRLTQWTPDPAFEGDEQWAFYYEGHPGPDPNNPIGFYVLNKLIGRICDEAWLTVDGDCSQDFRPLKLGSFSEAKRWNFAAKNFYDSSGQVFFTGFGAHYAIAMTDGCGYDNFSVAQFDTFVGAAVVGSIANTNSLPNRRNFFCFEGGCV